MRKIILFLLFLTILSSFSFADDLNTKISNVYDFGQTSGNLTDQVGSLNSTTVDVTDQAAAGINVGAWDFEQDSSNDVNMPLVLLNDSSNRSINCWIKPESNGAGVRHEILSGTSPGGITGLRFESSDNEIHFLITTGGEVADDSVILPALSTWQMLTVVYNNTHVRGYINGTKVGTDAAQSGYMRAVTGARFGGIGTTGNANNYDGLIDECYFWNRSLSVAEVSDLWNSGAGKFYPNLIDTTPPTLLNINCTSCDIPNGDTTPPYETYDTTPTFAFNTSENAWCRIADENWNYTTMGTSRNCTSGEGAKINHICTLKTSDELKLTPTDYTYIACINSLNNETKQSLEMRITQIQYNASKSIEKGIVISTPSATIYSDQQVYVRTVSNDQRLATFDKVALYGTQRWAFNYIGENETSIGTFYNLSPVFYFLEMINLSTQAIISQVSSLINSTKT